MADCYYHGYSGGPGLCSDCEREREQGLEQGTIKYDRDEHHTMEELQRREDNRDRERAAGRKPRF